MRGVARGLLGVALASAVLFVGCTRETPSSAVGTRPPAVQQTATPQPATADEAIRQLILLEGKALVAQDVEGLMNLWAEDAVIADAKHTADTGDDARWRGRDAIRERYVVLVFPGNPTSAGAKDIQVTITDDTATAISTTVIGGEVSPGGDLWRFVKREGRWWIQGLTYNLEAQ